MDADRERALEAAKLQLRLREALSSATSLPERRAAVAEVLNEDRLRRRYK